MKALVIGGTGFIGSRIVNDLLSRGLEVRATSRCWNEATINKSAKDGLLEYVYGDVTDPNSLCACVKGADLIFGCFGLLGNWGVPDSLYWETNTNGVRNVLNSIHEGSVRQYIHLSSAGVLGPLAAGIVADESFPLNPSNIYERTKCEAEKVVHDYAQARRIPFTIIRPEFVYGPGDLHVLGLFRAIKRGRFVAIGSKDSFLHPTYIDDVIQGIALCTANENAFGKTYLITGKSPVSVRQLGTMIAQELNVRLPQIVVPTPVARFAAQIFETLATLTHYSEPILTQSRVKFFTENRAFTAKKAESELGYRPKVDLPEGIRRTVRWYIDKGYL